MNGIFLRWGTRFLVFFLVGNLCAQFAQGQKVMLRKDTVKVDGVPYCLLVKKRVGPTSFDYSFRSLQNVELIYMKFDVNASTEMGGSAMNYLVTYTIDFKSLSKKVLYNKPMNAKKAATLVVKNKLLADNALDKTAVEAFVNKLNGSTAQPSGQAQTATSTNSIAGQTQTPVIPDSKTLPSSSGISLNDNRIYLQQEVIGKYASTTANGMQTMAIYFNNGDKLASCTAPVASPTEWLVEVLTEGKKYPVFYDAQQPLEQLVQWFIDKNYLHRTATNGTAPVK